MHRVFRYPLNIMGYSLQNDKREFCCSVVALPNPEPGTENRELPEKLQLFSGHIHRPIVPSHHCLTCKRVTRDDRRLNSVFRIWVCFPNGVRIAKRID
ncbi:hypothetical protein KQX54_002841 [Cotesia glomerata]|uniref:Uncharacterized protein n=1 Tax=Cotesia glomerata TaxID=32391 RepID=A0AAV7J1L7_COTGL|nr:hypothetical protein KQX54_002841 [Cotesia glomerata]